jgi:UDP-glucose 4-epimerase
VKTLVTGGSGFIGSCLTRVLSARGHQVTVVDNLSSGYRDNLKGIPSVLFVEGDIRDNAVLDKSMSGVEVVFHLAASVGNSRSIQDPLTDSDVNVLGTLRVLQSARRAGARRIVYSSSAGIFGQLKILPIAEDHPTEPSSPYGVSKLAAEKHCLVYDQLHGLEVVCLRYFNVYGINQRFDPYGNVIPIFAERLLRKEALVIFGDGNQTRDFVNVRDVAEANYRAATERAARGVYNIASGTSVSINDLARLMMRIIGSSAPIQYAAHRPGDVEHSIADVSAASTAFGYTPSVPLDEGLREYLGWALGVSA